jgi:hypothetical protein
MGFYNSLNDIGFYLNKHYGNIIYPLKLLGFGIGYNKESNSYYFKDINSDLSFDFEEAEKGVNTSRGVFTFTRTINHMRSNNVQHIISLDSRNEELKSGNNIEIKLIGRNKIDAVSITVSDENKTDRIKVDEGVIMLFNEKKSEDSQVSQCYLNYKMSEGRTTLEEREGECSPFLYVENIREDNGSSWYEVVLDSERLTCSVEKKGINQILREKNFYRENISEICKFLVAHPKSSKFITDIFNSVCEILSIEVDNQRYSIKEYLIKHFSLVSEVFNTISVYENNILPEIDKIFKLVPSQNDKKEKVKSDKLA